jgi:hypothetical protein
LTERRDAGDICTGPVPTGNEAELNGIPGGCEDDWDGACRCYRRSGGGIIVNADDGRNIAPGKIGGQLRQPIKLTC